MAQRTGYLLVDHSASPGLPEDIARFSGYDPTLCKEGKKYETDTLTCAHCKVTVVKSPTRTKSAMPRGNCPKCNMAYVCDFCAFQMTQPDYNHLPFEKRVDLMFNTSEKCGLGSPPSLIMPSS